jgi:hypothetical protein
MVLAVLVVAYLLARPLLAARVDLLVLYEYALGVALLAAYLVRLRARARRGAPRQPFSSPARRHVQQVRALPDPRHAAMQEAVQGFLERAEGRDRYREAMLAAVRGARLPDREARELAASIDALPAPRPRRRWLGSDAKAEAARRQRVALHERALERMVSRDRS